MLTAVGMAVLFGSPVRAATYYWDNNGTTVGFGTAGGTWTAPTANLWSSDPTGAAAAGPSITTGGADVLYFGTDTVNLGAGTINVSGIVDAAELLFGKNSGAITLSGGTINMSNVTNANIWASSAAGSALSTHTIDSNISKTNAGTLRFGRQNTSGENFIVNGIISGTASLELRPVNNGAYVALNGVNTFSGNISLVTGQLNVNTVSNSGVASSLGQGSIIAMGGNGGQQPLFWYTGAAAGSTNREFRSTSTSENRIVAQDGALTLAGILTTNNTGSYWFKFSGAANSGLNTVSGAIQNGTGTINVSVINTAPVGGSAEDGVWKFSGSNTYSGATSIVAGTLIFANKASQASGSAATVSAGGSIGLGVGAVSGDFSNGDVAGLFNSGTLSGFASFSMNAASGVALDTTAGNFTQSTALTATRALTKYGINTLTLTGANTYSGVTTIHGGTLQLGDGTSGNDGTVTSASIVNNANLTYNRFGSTTYGGVISGTGSVTKLGAGTQTLTGANTYSGTTTITTGTLQIGNGGTTGSIANTSGVTNNAALTYNRSDALTVGYAISGSGAVNQIGGGTTTLTGTNTYNGLTTISAGTLQIGNGGTTGSIANTSGVTNNSILTYNRSDALTASYTITGTGAVNQIGSGTTTLTGANTYTGTTTLAAGILKADVADVAATSGALGNGGDITFTGGTLQFTANSAGSDYSARIKNSTSAVTVDTNGQDVTWATDLALTNTGGLTKLGAGTLTAEFTDDNLDMYYTGLTKVEGGTLKLLNDDGQLQRWKAGDFEINNGSTLEIGGSDTTVFQGRTWTFGSSGGGTLNLVGNTIFQTDNNTIVTTGGTKNTLSGNKFNLQNSNTINFTVADGTDATDLEVSAQIDRGNIVKNGAGTLTLTNTTNTLLDSNTVTVNAGTLEIAGSGTLSGATWGGDMTNNGIVRYNSTANPTLTGIISGTGNLEKDNTGGLTLTGVNTYAGTTTISGGSVILGSGTGTTGTGAVTVQTGSTILGTGIVKGASFTAESGATVQAGDSTALGSYGTLTFTPVSGAGTFDFQSGSTVVLGINPGGTSDLLNFVGNGSNTLLFNGNLTVGPASFTPTQAEVFNLLDWSGLGSSPTFASHFTSTGLLTGNGDEAAGLDLSDISGSGFFWDISQFTTNGTIAIVVPEPSRAVLLLLGLIMIRARRRR